MSFLTRHIETPNSLKLVSKIKRTSIGQTASSHGYNSRANHQRVTRVLGKRSGQLIIAKRWRIGDLGWLSLWLVFIGFHLATYGTSGMSLHLSETPLV